MAPVEVVVVDVDNKGAVIVLREQETVPQVGDYLFVHKRSGNEAAHYYYRVERVVWYYAGTLGEPLGDPARTSVTLRAKRVDPEELTGYEL